MQVSGETNRVRILARIALIWAIAILGRLVYLQVISHADLKEIADQQHEKGMDIQVPRGTILDRTGKVLAKSVTLDSVCVSPTRVPDAQVAAHILAGVLELDEADLRAKIEAGAANRRGFLWVARRITREQSQRLQSLASPRGGNLDWIEFRPETQRHYPSGELASHLVGSVDFQEHGNSGVELALDDALLGTPGRVRLVRDVKQQVFESQTEINSYPAEDVTLTIDSRIQYSAEKALAEAVQQNDAKTGSVVVLAAKTGEILALANWPTFNPNGQPASSKGVTGRSNLAVTTPYEPGSVFKVVTVTAALEATRLTPESMIDCHRGVLRIGSRTVHEAHGGYGALSVGDVLARSSNIGAIEIARVIGAPKLHEYVQRFGFGKTTGLTVPSESAGMVRQLKGWGSTTWASVAMGHEVSVTTLQLAQACSVIANGGQLVRPVLVLKRQRPGEAARMEPRAKPVQVIKPETAITMRRLMEGVNILPYGTGFRHARLKGYTSGGKTGTAMIYDFATHTYTHRYNASYMGFAPLVNPAVVVVVTLTGTTGGGGYGGVASGPVFRTVATDALRILDVPKDLPDSLDEPKTNQPVDMNDLSIAGLDPDSGSELVSSIPPGLDEASKAPVQTPFLGPKLATVIPSAAVTGPKVPNFRGKMMRDVIREAALSGITVELIGHGVARAQAPEPGTALLPGERVRIQFNR